MANCFSAALVIPFVYSDRSSLYEHKGNASGERYHTQAGGLADLRAAVYLQGSYLFNPGNINGVPTRMANLNNPNPDTRMSIPDQYLARGGLSYTLLPDWGLAVSLGGRMEGVPAKDFFGDSDGFRRPGFLPNSARG